MEEVERSNAPKKSKKSWATIRHEEEVGQWMHSKKLQTKLETWELQFNKSWTISKFEENLKLSTQEFLMEENEDNWSLNWESGTTDEFLAYFICIHWSTFSTFLNSSFPFSSSSHHLLINFFQFHSLFNFFIQSHFHSLKRFQKFSNISHKLTTLNKVNFWK
jgi:hypothetical protein